MKKVILIPIIIGGALLITGSVLFGLAIANNTKNEVVTNEYDITDPYNDFNINLSTADLYFESSNSTTTKVVCVERTKEYHDVKVVDNTLTITRHDDLKWYERVFSWDFSPRKVTIYLPAKAYGDLNIKSSTGNIAIPSDFSFNKLDANLSTGDVNIKSNVTTLTKIETSTGRISLEEMNTNELNLKASTGDVYLKYANVTTDATVKVSTGRVNTNNFKANNLKINASTGSITLTDTLITTHIDIKTSTGDIKFNDSDADTIKIETDTGDVTGSLLTSKVFYVTSDTGKVNVPKSTTGGLCEIKTDTGDIKLTIKNA